MTRDFSTIHGVEPPAEDANQHDRPNAPIASQLIAGVLTVRDLRRRWKPIKEGEAAVAEHEPVRIRLHRAFSWMQRVDDLVEATIDADDARLVYYWIAFNALYGRWDAEEREPQPDRGALRVFTRTLFEHDRDGLLPTMMREHKKLAESIVGDEYLNRYYWQDPNDTTAKKAQNGVHKLRSMLVEGRCRAAMEMTIDRVYLARCQLIHGAATFDGRLNRDAVRRCARFMELFLPAMAVIIIDHAWREDWGALCYPPSL